MDNVLRDIKNKEDFRRWLENNHDKEKECYLILKRGKPIDDNVFYYLDAIEVALCFGWIDSTVRVIDGIRMQRFSPRQKNCLWTELNKERVRRLEKLGLMTDAGRKVLPDMRIKKMIIPSDVKEELINAKALSKFNDFPELYKRIRIYNLEFMREKLPNDYKKTLANFIKNTKESKLYGEWNDYGRLLNY